MIERINQQTLANLPIPKNIPLKNQQSEAIYEQIQTAYDNSYAPSIGDAQIVPISNPNSLLVIAQPAGVKAIEEIVIQMDLESEDGAMDGFRVFKLKHVAAADARDRLLTFLGQANLTAGDNSLPTVPATVISDFRSNTLTVKGAKRFLDQAEAFLKSIDVQKPEDGAKNVVRVFPLRNTLAEDLQIIIQDAINGQQQNSGFGFNPNQQAQTQQNQTQQQPDPNQSTLKSSALSMKTIDSTGREIEGGIMFGVRVSADRNSNSLVVTGPEPSMELIAELIRQLDRVPDAQTELKVFEIVNGDAELLLQMLETLFGTNNQQVGGGAGANTQAGSTLSQLPLQGTGLDGQTLVNLRFSIDQRTNTIIASGPAADLQTVEDLLNRLDSADIERSTTTVYRLSNAPALDIADALTQWVEARNDILTTDPRTQSNIVTTNRAINVVPEVVSNSLIVTARPEYKAEIEGIIRALDRRPPMVKVSVLIAEVTLTANEEFGVELGVQDSLLFDRGTVLNGNQIADGSIGFNFNQQNSANANATFPGDLASQAISNLGLGRINTELGYGGLVLSGGSESISILMRALKDRQCLRILSKPHIMTMENLQGRVSIGAEVPRVSGTSTTNFGITQDIEFVDVGVILEVTPRVSPDGLIVLAVNAKRSSVGGDETGITIGIQDGIPIIAPQLIETEANTTLMARSGQTVVFSGLIQEEKSHANRGAPIISDLPLLGPLFKFESDSSVRTELLIVMTPYLVTDEQDVAMLNQDEADRMHWCEADVAEVFGSANTSRMIQPSGATEVYRPVSDPTGIQPVQTQGPVEIPPGYDAIPLGKKQNAGSPMQSRSAANRTKTNRR